MARKIQYRAVPIERVSPEGLAAALAGASKLVVSIDVAKTKMMAGFGGEDGAVVRLIRWQSPLQTRAFVELVVETGRVLAVPIEALMEPTGTYGDPLRGQLLGRGLQVFTLSPKRVHDAAEVFDGVPSMHDAKACVVIARLHQQAISRKHVEPSELRVRLRALIDQRELYDKPLQMHLGKLEALLARHWPEALDEIDVWRNKTPLALLAAHPCPAEIHAHGAAALELIHRVSRNTVKQDQAQRWLLSAERSVGLPAVAEARQLIGRVAAEALRLRNALDEVDRSLEEVATQNDATGALSSVVGKVTAVVLVAHLGPFTDYASAAALEKSCGLNLKMRSSGNHVGRLAITKRGSSIVRQYLFLAALRLIKADPRVATWFRARAGYRGGNKLIAVVAVMRKLIRALWHVARGNEFDSSKLIDERAQPRDCTALIPLTSHDAAALPELSAVL